MVGYGEARAFARLIMPDLVKRGFGANRIIRELGSMGMETYRRKVMLSDIREYTGLIRREASARAASPDLPFPKGSMVETELMADVKYRGFLDVEFRDTETGEVWSSTKSFYTEELKSPEGWIDDFTGRYQEYWGRKGYELTSIKLKGVEHAAGWRY